MAFRTTIAVMNDLRGCLRTKAVTAPATTTVAGWAAELAVGGHADIFSAYALLSARSMRIDRGTYPR